MKKEREFKIGARWIALLGLVALVPTRVAGLPPRPNVLMICVDDLRPMLGCYGDPIVRSPNIDGLAARGMLFERAYCQSPQCGPSRVSFMTGLRPGTTGIYSLRDRFKFDRVNGPAFVTLPEHFIRYGYHARAYGKIYHDGRDDPQSWSTPASPGRENEILEIADLKALEGLPFEKRAAVPTLIAPRTDCPAWQSPDLPDEALYAGRMTTEVLAALGGLKEKPFFLAVGYRRPHLPFVAPKKYFDLYPPSPRLLPAQTEAPIDAPYMAFYNAANYAATKGRGRWGVPLDPRDRETAVSWNGFELRSYQLVPDHGRLTDEMVIQLRRAYLACVTYVDTQIGRLLEGLRREGLAGNTIVCLFSDHGWHLGEHGTWSKMTNYEWSARVPLIISAPGLPPGQTRALSELVDVYPTLCELAGLPIPNHAEGDSLLPWLRDPALAGKTAAFTQFPRKGWAMGRAVRTDRYRYVEWRDEETDEFKARELYDLGSDPGETVNIAGRADEAVVAGLSKLLRARWPSVRP
jgi:iduronate 2-sulfatase